MKTNNMRRRTARAIVYTIIGGVVGDIIDIAIYFAAAIAATLVLALVLPTWAAFALALLSVSLWRGYRIARRIEQARTRGELR